MRERGHRQQAHQAALEVADVAADPVGDQEQHVLRQRAPAALLLAAIAQDRDPGLEIGLMHVGHQALVEARGEPLLEHGDVLGRFVGRDDDLLVSVAQGVEGVEEFLLRALLAGQELDVVDEQDVHVAVLVAERQRLAVLDGVDHLVGEPLRRDVVDAQPGPRLLGCVADGVEEMGLAEPRSAEDEERVVDRPGVGRHGEAAGVGEAVARAHDEAAEREPRVELAVEPGAGHSRVACLGSGALVRRCLQPQLGRQDRGRCDRLLRHPADLG